MQREKPVGACGRTRAIRHQADARLGQQVAHLEDVDRQLQALRQTVSMERRDFEIIQAAEQLALLCHLTAATLAGARSTLRRGSPFVRCATLPSASAAP